MSARVSQTGTGLGARAMGAALASMILAAPVGRVFAAAPAARKAPAVKYVPLHAPCPEALDDGTPVDPHLAETLLSLAASVSWTRADGPPSTCHPAVKLTCGPDLDGDGDAEAIVQVQGWTAADDTPCAELRPTDDRWAETHTFLATHHRGTWRAVARLDAGLSAADEPEARRASFVWEPSQGSHSLPRWARSGEAGPPPTRSQRRPGGRALVRVDWTSLTTESGCRIAGYEILELRAGALHRIELGDNSRSCQLCDCSP